MVDNVDDKFYERADAHIHLANDQLEDLGRGKVSASMMYGIARFNAWICACDAATAEEMLAGRQEAVEYFVNQYKKMFEENFDDYIENFEKYMKPMK